jgi:hypothetical protein
MKARDGHQVGHAGRSEDIPIRTIDRVLVAGDQRGDHPGRSRLRHALEDGIAHGLPQALDRMAPGDGDAFGARVPGAGSHLARGVHALLPQAQFLVEAMRVEIAVGRPEPHRHAPAFAGVHGAGRVGRTDSAP